MDDVGQSLVHVGQLCPTSGQVRPTLVEICQRLAHIGQYLAEASQFWPNVEQCWSTLARLGQASAGTSDRCRATPRSTSFGCPLDCVRRRARNADIRCGRTAAIQVRALASVLTFSTLRQELCSQCLQDGLTSRCRRAWRAKWKATSEAAKFLPHPTRQVQLALPAGHLRAQEVWPPQRGVRVMNSRA